MLGDRLLTGAAQAHSPSGRLSVILLSRSRGSRPLSETMRQRWPSRPRHCRRYHLAGARPRHQSDRRRRGDDRAADSCATPAATSSRASLASPPLPPALLSPVLYGGFGAHQTEPSSSRTRWRAGISAAARRGLLPWAGRKTLPRKCYLKRMSSFGEPRGTVTEFSPEGVDKPIFPRSTTVFSAER